MIKDSKDMDMFEDVKKPDLKNSFLEVVLPEDISNNEIIKNNEDFFNKNTLIKDTDIIKNFLLKIEDATYVSEETYISNKHKAWGAIFKENLSTGTKTFINIVTNPDKIFSLCECGSNVINEIYKLNYGKVLYRSTSIMLPGETTCNIKIHNRHFNKISDFLDYVEEYYDRI